MNNKTTAAQDFFAVRQDPQGQTVLALSGRWTVYNANIILESLPKALKGLKQRNYIVDTAAIEDIDTAGAWLIKRYFQNNSGLAALTDRQKALLDFLPTDAGDLPAKKNTPAFIACFINLGKLTQTKLSFAYSLMVFIGRIFTRFLLNFSHPRHFRFPSIVRHIYEAGIQAVPIVALLGFLMSMVISYQAAIQLQKFGADIFTIDLSVISILREMGVLITAIMVAGRSGSAFAAEIGVMKLREEVDALKTMGMDPIEILVLPRMIALIIALPLLTLIADLIGMAGASLMSLLLMDIQFQQYLDRAQVVATPTMFFVGMIKAPVFAFLIAVIGTYQGMNVSGSAESVGRLTTVAVVQSIFLVIMADAAFSVIFSKVGL